MLVGRNAKERVPMSAAPQPTPDAHDEEGDAQPRTPIRALEERTRGLDLEAQMVECVDLLQSPEFLVDDLVRSVDRIRDQAARETRTRVALVSGEGEGDDPFFYPSRELFVNGAGCSFTCLATEIDFVGEEPGRLRSVAESPAGSASSLRAEAPHAIDYAAVTCEARPFPTLGFAQHSESESAYPILLRGLASLIELTRPRRFDVLDREVYRGLLGPAPVFDLTLVLWDDDSIDDPRRPLCELTRDLAECIKNNLLGEARFVPVLNDIVCLRMNNKRFDGRLRFVWRV
jgi:hypothetical protein